MRDKKRYFDTDQKNEIYNRALGKCECCGEPLNNGWHAHHKVRWSEGGRTIIENGMAVCPDCHKELEGDYVPMYTDNIQLRAPQEQMETVFLKMLSEYKDGDKPPVLVAIMACGSGKTLGAEHCCNVAYRGDYADGAIYLTPRIALCDQYEESWDNSQSNREKGDKYTDFSQFYGDPKMGVVRSKTNKNPVLFADQSGYSITYSALVEDLKKSPQKRVHFNPQTGIISRRFILVLDEAQSLGYTAIDDSFSDSRGKKAYTNTVEQYYNHPNCVAVILMTATDVRSDSMPLFLGKYSEPDDRGRRTLLADVRFSYVDGVMSACLRPFEFHLEGAELDIEQHDIIGNVNGEKVYNSRETSQKLEKFMHRPEVWKLLADKTVEQLLYVREEIWEGYQCLIAAIDIRHAGEISAYLEEKYPKLKSIVVVGDVDKIEEDKTGKISRSLKEFKNGNYDILISVRMAYVGFNHPRLTVVGVLTHWRHFSFLEQLLGRGGRVMRERPIEEQTLWVIGLDDKLMRKFAEHMREASLGSIKWPPDDGDWCFEAQGFDVVTGVRLTGSIGEGFDEIGTLDIDVHEPFSNVLKESRIIAPPTTVASLVRRSGGSVEAIINPNSREDPDNGDVETIIPILRSDELRTQIENNIKSLAGYISKREKRDWLEVKMELNTSLFPGKMENHWKKFRNERDYLTDLNNINALLESRIEEEKRLLHATRQI